MRVMLIRIAVVCLLVVSVLTVGACVGLGGRGEPNQADLARQAAISVADAHVAAVATVPGSVQGLRLGKDAGKVIYDILIQPLAGGQAQAVEVDASTGQVVKTQPARDLEDGGD